MHAPLRSKTFLISCSFWENPPNLYVGAPPQGLAPPLWRILYPPLVQVHGRFSRGLWGGSPSTSGGFHPGPEGVPREPLPPLLSTDMPATEAGSTHPTEMHSCFCYFQMLGGGSYRTVSDMAKEIKELKDKIQELEKQTTVSRVS